MTVEEYCLKVKALADKLACAGSHISEKDLLIQILNGLGHGYLDLASIITTNKMSYNDAYALLLTHEAMLEQSQNAKNVFNANYGMMNVNYPQTKGYNKRGGYNGYQGHSGRGMMFNANPRSFANGAHSFGRGQLMHI